MVVLQQTMCKLVGKNPEMINNMVLASVPWVQKGIIGNSVIFQTASYKFTAAVKLDKARRARQKMLLVHVCFDHRNLYTNSDSSGPSQTIDNNTLVLRMRLQTEVLGAALVATI